MAKVALNTMVAPETLEAIRGMATGKSQGQVVDEAIAALQGGDKHGEVGRWFQKTWERLDEILETVQTVETPAGAIKPVVVGGQGEPGFPIQCRHCGERRQGGTRFATICFGCKSAGHTNEPRECPVCTAGQGI